MVRTRWIGPRVVATALGLALLAGLGGCKGDNGGESSETTTTAAPTTTEAPTTTLSGPEQDAAAVKAAVQRYYAAVLKAFDPPDPQNGELAASASGQALEDVKGLLSTYKTRGQYARRKSPGPYEVHLGVPEISANEALLTDCVIDDGATYDATGAIVDDTVVAARYRTVLARTATGWILREHKKLLESPDLTTCRGGQ